MKSIKKIYMIEMSSKNAPGPEIVGIASSDEKKIRMLNMLRDTVDETSGTKYEAYSSLVDCLIIDDQTILF